MTLNLSPHLRPQTSNRVEKANFGSGPITKIEQEFGQAPLERGGKVPSKDEVQLSQTVTLNTGLVLTSRLGATGVALSMAGSTQAPVILDATLKTDMEKGNFTLRNDNLRQTVYSDGSQSIVQGKSWALDCLESGEMKPQSIEEEERFDGRYGRYYNVYDTDPAAVKELDNGTFAFAYQLNHDGTWGGDESPDVIPFLTREEIGLSTDQTIAGKLGRKPIPRDENEVIGCG